MIKIYSKKERQDFKNAPPFKAIDRKIGWLVGAFIFVANGVANSAEYVYEIDGTFVSLYNSPCQNLNHSEALSEELSPAQHLLKHLTVAGVNGEGEGCWFLMQKSQEVAFVSDVDSNISQIELQEFQKTKAEKPIGAGGGPEVTDTVQNKKIPKAYGSTANLQKEEGFYVEQATDRNGVPDTSVGHPEWYVFNFLPQSGSCASGNPKFSYALEQKYKQSFASAYYGVATTFVRTTEGGDYISYKPSSICYFVQGDKILIVGAHRPVKLPIEFIKKRISINGEEL